jgi:endonuclease/exonuclease/phosphatase family metal-dependent hydrolase
MRIASFNVENLDDRPGATPDLAERIRILRPQLERLAADILCLQEVNAQKPAGGKRARREFRALDALIAGTDYESFHRVTSLRRDGAGPADVQNLVILSREPLAGHCQYWHDLVAPPVYRCATAVPPDDRAAEVTWDRPVLHAWIERENGWRLDVFNTHLRAPLAAFVPGQKLDSFAWKSAAGWAEGFYLATMKRAGQALEARLAVDRIFDTDPDALIAVCGDMNAELAEMPLRILRAEEEDTANGALAGRVLVPIERAVPDSLRFSVVHAGRNLMLDHLLVSRRLLACCRNVEIHNEGLEDEVVGYAIARGSPESYHAPIVAEFDMGSDG